MASSPFFPLSSSPSIIPPTPSSVSLLLTLLPKKKKKSSICYCQTQQKKNPHVPGTLSSTTTTLTAINPNQGQSSPQEPKSKPTIRSRLSQLCKDGRLDVALSLFNAITQPSTILWNTIIIGFICNDMPQEVLLLYNRMRTCSTSTRDFYTYSSVLKACAKTQQLKFGKAVHCQIIRTLSKPNRILENSLLSMYSCCLSPSFQESHLEVDVVQKLFDRMLKRNVVTYNTMVAWYAKTGRPIQAIMQFKLMIDAGIRPTVISFINAFPALSVIGDSSNCNVLYGMLLKFGPSYVDDPFATSSAIFMYSELSAVDSARQVFDCSTVRNTQVWNTMMDGYVQNDCPAQAIELFLKILNSDKQDIFPDAVTVLTALMAVSQVQQLEFGQQIHAYVIKYPIDLPVILCNALMVMYSRCDSLDMALSVFEKMVERDFVSWNTMVSAFVQNGLNAEGLMLFSEMQKQGLYIDSITAIALLSAASNLGSIQIGKETHAYLFRHGIQFEGMNSYLIDMYAKSGAIENARRLFEKDRVHERDLVTWNSMIAGYVQNGEGEQAIGVLRQMLEQSQIPNSVTLASILPACNPTGGVNMGKQLHCFCIRHLLDGNVFVGTSLVDMYSKSGLIDYAERIFDRMMEKNAVTYTSMISGFGQHGRGERAHSLFQTMLEAGMKPDAVTLVAMLSACSYSGLVDEGLCIFKSMEEEYGILPTSEHCCCVVDMLGRAGRVAEAYEFVKEMGDKYNTMAMWGSLLGACRIHQEHELGKLVADKLFEMEKGTGTVAAGHHILLSNMYAADGEWENVDRVRKGMEDKGLRKEAGYSWIEIGGMVHRFISRDQIHPQRDEVYATLDEMAVAMKFGGYYDYFETQT